jgi:hypothetical protein
MHEGVDGAAAESVEALKKMVKSLAPSIDLDKLSELHDLKKTLATFTERTFD